MKLLDEVLKEELVKIDEKIIDFNSLEKLKKLVNRLNSNSINLVYLDSSELFFLKEIFKTDILSDTILKARFLLTYAKEIDVTNYDQYKDVMNSLKEIYNLLLKKLETYENNNIDVLRQIKEKYVLLLHNTNGNAINDSLSIDFVLKTLEMLKLDSIDENRVLVNLVLQELKKYQTESDDYSNYLTEDEKNIYELALELLEEKNDELVNLKSNSLYNGYVEMYKQGLIDTIDDIEIKNNVKLIMFESNVNDLRETLNLLKSLNQNQTEEKEYLQEQLIILFDKIKPFLIQQNTNQESTNKYQLIFLDEAKDDFDSKDIKEVIYRNQTVSLLNELKNGDFKKEDRIQRCSLFALFRKKKLNIRLLYMKLSSNLLLIIGIKHKTDTSSIYDEIIRRVESNKTIIENIINASKTSEGISSLLESNKEINDRIDELIEKRNKSLEGDSYGK